MADDTFERVATHPGFQEMTRKRNRFAVVLSVIVLAVYYSFVLVAVYAPAQFAAPLAEGLTWPIGLLAGFLIQGFAFVMTGIYVRRANSEFDALNRKILEEVA